MNKNALFPYPNAVLVISFHNLDLQCGLTCQIFIRMNGTKLYGAFDVQRFIVSSTCNVMM